MAAVLAVMLTSLEIVFEIENCLMGELCFSCNLLKTEIWSKKEYIFKANDQATAFIFQI